MWLVSTETDFSRPVELEVVESSLCPVNFPLPIALLSDQWSPERMLQKTCSGNPSVTLSLVTNK